MELWCSSSSSKTPKIRMRVSRRSLQLADRQVLVEVCLNISLHWVLLVKHPIAKEVQVNSHLLILEKLEPKILKNACWWVMKTYWMEFMPLPIFRIVGRLRVTKTTHLLDLITLLAQPSPQWLVVQMCQTFLQWKRTSVWFQTHLWSYLNSKARRVVRRIMLRVLA